MKDKIKEIRKKTGMSQNDFANFIGMPLNTLRNWEQGINKPSEWLVKLIEFYVESNLKEKEC